LEPAQVYHIENPVSDRFFDIVSQPEPMRILCPVRVIPRKGLLFALRALPELRKEFPGVELRIAGESLAMPSYLATCQSFIARHGLGENVRFLDTLTPSEMADEYARCTLMVLPSIQETAPVTVGEAMAAGVPIVATRVGGVPHMVQDGLTGLLVNYGDVDGLTAALRRVLTDVPLRQSMARAARGRANERFRLSVVAERTAQVYEQVLARAIGGDSK
jgi:glycogen(starch) synthase